MAPRPGNFNKGGMNQVNPYKARNQAWIREICNELGITITELARRSGVDAATLTRFMNNPKYKPNLSDTTLQKISEAVRRPLPAGGVIQTLSRQPDLNTVRVVGAAAAGLWKDVSIIADEYYVHEEIPVIESKRYAGFEQYALLVEGNSINRKIRDGEYAICVAWAAIGGLPKDGQYVHVERNRNGLQEVTIKQVRIVGKSISLWPDSDDARFQTPLEFGYDEDDAEVQIRGLVIGTFRHF